MENQIDPTLKPLADDAIADVALVIKAVKAYKAGGKSALIGLIPEAETLIHKEIDDVKAALPSIKVGYKTTEFWLVIGVLGLVGGLAFAGKPLPIDAEAALTVVITAYTLIRGVVKKTPPAA